MSVADYYARFIQLARFAPQCDVPDEAATAYKFQRVVKPEYKSFMVSHEWTTVEEVHEVAFRLEREAIDSRRQSNYRARRNADDRSGKRAAPAAILTTHSRSAALVSCTPTVSIFGASGVGSVSTGATSEANG